MPRGHRLQVWNGVVHVTHRCHNKSMLLKFIRDRDAYLKRAWELSCEFGIHYLGYCVTNNHVHSTIDMDSRTELGCYMQHLAGEFARDYNRRKKRLNAFWGDNYWATFIDTGLYLLNCLTYGDLNMVRCGQVSHPREWAWCGYQEYAGLRRRRRLVDFERLLWRTESHSMDQFLRNYEFILAEKIRKKELQREPMWTEAIAVGKPSFLDVLELKVPYRARLSRTSLGDVHILKENSIPYGFPLPC